MSSSAIAVADGTKAFSQKTFQVRALGMFRGLG